MKKLLFGLSIMCICNAYADDTELAEQVRYKEEIVHALREEILQIESETLRCEKSKKGWIAATVIGGTGVVATGTAAIVQGVKLKEKQKSKKETKEAKEGDK